VDVGWAIQTLTVYETFGYDLTIDDMRVEYNYNWNCVNRAWGWHTMRWRVGTGWRMRAWYTYPLANPLNYSWVRAKGYSYYGNSLFPSCFGDTVYTNHRDNTVYVYKDGTATYQFLFDITGASCKQFLSRHIRQENNGF
jgi:hypothetical protein